MHPFRFCVQSTYLQSGPSWAAFARRCEALGYDALYTSDHFGAQLSPIAAMAYAAAATDHLRLGCLVFGNDYRHPAVLAREIGTVDLLSGGRVELGIGAGWMIADYEALGVPYDPPGVRVDRLVEAIAIIKALWTTGEVDHIGEHYVVRGQLGMPMPKYRLRPKLLIGGGGRRVLGIAAREADIVNLSPQLTSGVAGREITDSTVASRYDERIEWVRAAAGERFATLELQVLLTHVEVTDARREAIARAAERYGMTAADVDSWPRAVIGSTDEIVEQLEARRNRFGISSWVVRGSQMDDFGPVVAALAGS